MKVNQSVRFGIKQYGNSDANPLREALSKVPPGIPVQMTIHHSQGDRPWESDTYELELKWVEER